MEALIALSPSAQTARMEIVVMMPPACARLGGKEARARIKHAALTAQPMEESVTMATACALLALLEFSARPRWTSAPTNVLETECVMSGPSSAIAKRDSRDLTAPLQAVPRDATSRTANAMLANAIARPTSPEMTARKRSAPTTVLAMVSVIPTSVCAIATLAGLDMTAA